VVSWEDTFTDQLREDIFIDQQQFKGPDLTCDPRSGRIGAMWDRGYPRCDKAGPEGRPSGEAGYD
jgi:hypothetical protein